MHTENLNVSRLFFDTAGRIPDTTALYDGDQQRSFAEFAAEVRATAAALRKSGVGQGDRVLIFVPMGLDLYRVVMAVFQIGATAVFLDEWVSLDRLRLCCRLARCKAFVADWKFRLAGWFIPEIRQIPLKPDLSFNLENQEHSIAFCTEKDTALITFTTGSTGTPKAADRTHRFLRSQFDALIREIKPRPGDVVMTTLPIVLLVNFGTGASSVVARFSPKKAGRLKPAEVLKNLQQRGVNTLIASPYFVRKLAETALYQPGDLRQLQKIFTGGAPVFPLDADLYCRAFPGAEIRIVYGSTESEPISAIAAEDLLAQPAPAQSGGLCVGFPDEHIQLKIIEIRDEPMDAAAFSNAELPAGQIGEITVAGEHVLKAYVDNESAFRRNKIVDDEGNIWHRSGDAGFLAPDGKLHLTGRCNQMIRRENRWIAPFIWESVLAASGLVQCGTVLENAGRLVLVLQPLPGKKRVDEALIRAFFTEPIDQILFVSRIPMDPRHHSKIDYEGVRKILN